MQTLDGNKKKKEGGAICGIRFQDMAVSLSNFRFLHLKIQKKDI